MAAQSQRADASAWCRPLFEGTQLSMLVCDPVSQEILDKTDAWLSSAEPNAALRRLVSESRAGVERALKAQAADASA